MNQTKRNGIMETSDDFPPTELKEGKLLYIFTFPLARNSNYLRYFEEGII
jgi:hypothetical protein